MTAIPVLGAEDCAGLLTMRAAVQALRQGHLLPKAEIKDSFINDTDTVLLSRAAAIKGMGQCVKTVTVRAGNPALGLPTVQGGLMLFHPGTGAVRAIIESSAVTNLKTVADSLLGTELLARPDAKQLLIIGTGAVAAAMAKGYARERPGLQEISIYGRARGKAEELVAQLGKAGVAAVACPDLPNGIANADIITTATSSVHPVLDGTLVQPGTHLDLVGAYRADMREADDIAMRRAKIFVDSRQTTMTDIGEIAIPLSTGVITPADIRADFYDLIRSPSPARGRDDITICKNGGGAHLDLMISDALLNAWEARHLPA